MLSIIDLDRGATTQVVNTSQQAPILGLAWTKDRTVTLAVDPGSPAIADDVGTVTVDLAGVPGAGD